MGNCSQLQHGAGVRYIRDRVLKDNWQSSIGKEKSQGFGSNCSRFEHSKNKSSYSQVKARLVEEGQMAASSFMGARTKVELVNIE